MLHLIACPDPTCHATAELTDRFTLWSTDGPVEHYKTYCVRRHFFILPAQWRANATVQRRAA